ncbi:MAG: MBL fold metallo-hydrolase [Candidatus Babeliaceae bacterium]|nr:MBL fold metallo-hydrolase [Candidatus Babeliaceae bacterium]
MGDQIFLERKNGRFAIVGKKCGDGIFGVARMFLDALKNRKLAEKYRGEVVAKGALPPPSSVLNSYSGIAPLVTWIGHATFLIQVAGMTVLVDPLFSPLSCLFPRIVEPACSLAQLPPIDCVLVSHNHFDHLDERALRFLAQKNAHMSICVPLGDEKWLRRLGYKTVVGWDWWESHLIRSSRTEQAMKCTFVPAIHWSRRGIFDYNRSLWGGWVIEMFGHTIYCAGDTAYGSHFQMIRAAFSRIDTTIIPIAPSEPHDRLKDSHLSAEEAGEVYLELGAERFIPAHWGTFCFENVHPREPLRRLVAWWQEHKPAGVLSALNVGESVCCEVESPIIMSPPYYVRPDMPLSNI